MKFYIGEFFEILSRKFKFHENLTGITGTLHEEQYTFLFISLPVFIGMRNISGINCSENQNTHFILNSPYND
jgi:hypothetical protein